MGHGAAERPMAFGWARAPPPPRPEISAAGVASRTSTPAATTRSAYRWMDLDGVDAEVTSPRHLAMDLRVADDAVHLEMVRAYNDFVSEFASHAPTDSAAWRSSRIAASTVHSPRSTGYWSCRHQGIPVRAATQRHLASSPKTMRCGGVACGVRASR